MKIRKNVFYVIFVFVFFVSGLNQCYGAEQHALFTEVLKKHVQEGMVDYQNLCSDQRFKQYIDQLASADPERLSSREEKLAFWINVYNAYTLKIICDNYPLKSISELHTGGLILGSVLKSTVWHKNLVTVNNELTSLDHVEHQIIRPVFRDARIHFAVVCAAKGCPPLRSEAYEGGRLDAQLDDQGREFLSQTEKNNFDPNKKTARISPIFSWFKDDFRMEAKTVLEYVAPFLDTATAESIKANPKSWRIKYTDYDWSLNEQ
jgi:hypothetical protein